MISDEGCGAVAIGKYETEAGGVSSGASTDQLRQACRRMGMTTLRQAGLNAIFSGQTTIEEVVHETVLEDEL